MHRSFARHDVSFRSDDADCAAWLYVPEDAHDAACVTMAHGFGGTREERLDAFAQRFAEAGLVVLLFDYRHFGASGGTPRQIVDADRQLADWRAAIAFARARPEVDAGRVAIWGSSFSGGHVLRLGAEDARLAAVVSQVPFIDGRAARFSLGQTLRLAAAGLWDALRARLGLHPHYIPIVAGPGELGVLTTPDSRPGYLALVKPESRFENRVAARVALGVSRLHPGAQAERIACPLLVCVATRDVVTPPEPARDVARRAQAGELREYEAGHFEVYVAPLFERVVEDELAFLQKHLGPMEGDALEREQRP